MDGRFEIEVGYHLLREHWGKGYATEAARVFRNYGFETTETPSIISIIHPDNLPSQRVAIRNGMTLWAKGQPWHNEVYDIYRITREEWEKVSRHEATNPM
jgi:RimJ/RimL family protein N-acetyltransferase